MNSNDYYCFSADVIEPRFPTVPFARPSDEGNEPFTVAQWSELYHDRSGYSAFSVLLQLEPALLLGAYRSIYGQLPRTDENDFYLFNLAELRDLVMSLWPEARTQRYVRRCKSGQHLEKLRAKASAK